MSDTVKKVLGWVIGITVLLLFISFVLPSLIQRAFSGIGDMFKSKEQKEKEEQAKEVAKQLAKAGTLGIDHEAVSDDLETLMRKLPTDDKGVVDKWKTLKTAADLEAVYQLFGKRLVLNFSNAHYGDLVDWFNNECSLETRKLLRAWAANWKRKNEIKIS